jgi:hypothetical protein
MAERASLGDDGFIEILILFTGNQPVKVHGSFNPRIQLVLIHVILLSVSLTRKL